jgi:hypothetical protein
MQELKELQYKEDQLKKKVENNTQNFNRMIFFDVVGFENFSLGLRSPWNNLLKIPKRNTKQNPTLVRK